MFGNARLSTPCTQNIFAVKIRNKKQPFLNIKNQVRLGFYAQKSLISLVL